MTEPISLILYSKPGCHLCEGLQEKLETLPGVTLEIRDITTRDDWFAAYQYDIPVLCRADDTPLPRPSPRASARQVAQMLQKYYPHLDTK